VPRFEQAARRLKEFLAARMFQQGRLLKTRAGKRVFAYTELDDYAFAAAGLADYARLFKDPAAEVLARDLVVQAWKRFFSPEGWRREEQPLLATLRPEPALADGALPSPAARLMTVTRSLARDHPGLAQARAMLPPALVRAPFDHPGGLAALEGR
jgi:uncharacterized protein YyaL (SSP411 family)